VTAGNLYEPMPKRAGIHGGWRWSLPRGATGAALAFGLIGAVAAGVMLAARPAHGDESRAGSRGWRGERDRGPQAAARARVGRAPELAPGVPTPPGVA
jgi:hypothetical protein